MKILNFGSLNIDKTYTVSSIVRPGETVNSIKYEEFIGGKGLNQSVALANAGGNVWHGGLVGLNDGQVLIDRLVAYGVNVDFVERRDFQSGHAIIQVDSRGMNSIIVDGGTNRLVDKEFSDKVLSNFSKGDMLLLQNEISNLPYIVDKAYGIGMTIALNPSPMDILIDEIDLSKITYFLVNEIEAEKISGITFPDQAVEKILNEYPHAKVVMTLGSDGAVYKDKDKYYRVFGNDVNVVDTTGAGDTFCGYFLASISNGKNIEESMDLANLAASISCTIAGASNSIPLIEDII